MKITVKIHPHTDEELKQLVSVLSSLSFGDNPKPPSTTVSVTPNAPVTSAVQSTTKVLKVDPPKVEAPKVDTGEVTLEILRSIVQDKIQKGHRDSIKAALTKFGAANVSALKPENFVEFHGIITALK